MTSFLICHTTTLICMTIRILLFLLCMGSTASLTAQLSTYDLRTESLSQPIGMDILQPRLSWKIRSERPGTLQTAYELRVGNSPTALAKGKDLIWQSGKVAERQSHLLPYGGPSLLSSRRYYWQVRIWDNHGQSSAWSDIAFWEMGKLASDDWQAQWISATWPETGDSSLAAHQYRHDFRVEGAVTQARLYVTAQGVYEAQLNGRPISEDCLAPGWTSYQERLQYQTYDVTDLLSRGDNAIGVTVGDGWFRGNLGWSGQRGVYGDRLALLAQLELTYRDGRVVKVLSGPDWTAHPSPILSSDLYNGERYDARQETPGWTQASFSCEGWSPVEVLDLGVARLIAPVGTPVRRIEELPALRVFSTPKGEQVIDFGQNMVGWVKFSVQGESGHTVTISHAEVLDQDGNFYTENLRSADQQIRYTLRGGDMETYEPHFTFMGFRYLRVENWPGTLRAIDFSGVVVHSDMPSTGSFTCSDSLINQLQENIRWGQKGNFLDVPTDCPQRDERLGWTGDAQAFFSTAAFNYDVGTFFSKWLGDMAADQLEDGQIPIVVPNVLAGQMIASATGWSDAGLIIPWQLYERYGDRRVLETQYESMKGWLDYMIDQSGESLLWTSGWHFGDWLSYNPPYDLSGGSAITFKPLIQQAFFAHATWIMWNTAQVLGKEEDARRYEKLLPKIRQAFQQEYLSPAGRLVSETQTAYVLALHFDMVADEQREQVAANLAANVKRYGHLTTGFLGTPYLCFVLTKAGYLDLAYQLLHRQEYPSWLYPVTKGATTIWERWDGIQPDGAYQDVGMNSFNHYAYGAIGDWLYRDVCGINPDANSPGYQHVILQPQPGGTLSHASATFESVYGSIEAGWRLEGDQIRFECALPPNTTATLKLPHSAGKMVTGTIDKADDQDLVLQLGSGTHQFSYDWSPAQVD